MSEAVLALDLVDTELDLAEGVFLILLEISQRDLEYPALQGVVGVLETGGPVHKSLSNTVNVEKKNQDVSLVVVGMISFAIALSRR